MALSAADTGGTDGNDPRVVAGKAAWKAGHEALAIRSSQGASRVVPHSGRCIHQDQPGIVVSAILELAERSGRNAD